MLPSSVLKKLKALKYPNVESAALSDFETVVLFLEQEKIRCLKMSERAWMKPPRCQEAIYWIKLEDYLQELGISAAGANDKNKSVQETARLRILDRLLSCAILDIYQDNDEAGKFVENKNCYAPRLAAEGQLADLKPHVNRVLEAYELPRLDENLSGPGLDRAIIAALQCVATRSKDPTNADNPDAISKSEIKNLPIGFATESNELNHAVAVLRMLHVADLRSLQGKVNNTINELQEITADPKTDCRLGRVGR